MLKKICMLTALVLLLCLGFSALADGGVNVEVIRADGVSVVVLTPEETVSQARTFAQRAASEGKADIVLPEFLTMIAESAFEGIEAERVDVSANVVAIESRAFADCRFLREIHIPSTVLKVDDRALEGCENVTVYGVTGSEAERFAYAAGFRFVDPEADAPETESPAVRLPLVPRR